MPRYLNDLDVFYDPSQAHAFSPAFDEGLPAPIPLKAITLVLSSTIFNSSSIPQYGLSSSSIDTSVIDGFTQGVELTQLKRHDAGIAKIWSGEPGHQMLLTWYGDKGPGITQPFSDSGTAYFQDATAIVDNSPNLPVLMFPLQAPQPGSDFKSQRYVTKRATNKVFYRVDQDLNYAILNGVIEPLTIRLVPSFYTNLVDPRGIVGSIGSGNEDEADRSDQVLTVDYYDVKRQQAPFADISQNPHQFRFIRGTVPLTSASVLSLNVPVTPPVAVRAVIDPYVDVRYVRNTVASPYESTSMLNALSLMTGSTSNYISDNRRSATCGLVYDNTTQIGTDSLVFGGMTH
jgi:hypothetical protein